MDEEYFEHYEPYVSDLALSFGFYDEDEFQRYCDEQEKRALEDRD